VKSGSCLVRSCNFFAALFLCFQLSAGGQTKPIRLRTETILTPPKANLKQAQSQAQALTSGLFLVQFNAPPNPTQLAELSSAGVRLLKYVPEDAFIARFSGAAAERVRALDFVRWVGAYRPDHKVHPRLAAAMRATSSLSPTLSVTALLAPGSASTEVVQARALFDSVDHESRLRQGTILRGAITPARLDALTQSGAVLWVERASKRKLVDEMASKIVGGDDGATGTRTVTQQQGFGGAGVTVCVADTGLDTGDTNTMHPDLRGRVSGFQPYSPLTDGSDGYGHGTHAAGIVAGNAATGETDPDSGGFYGLGVAPDATLFIERIFDDSAAEVSPPPSDEDLARDAVRNGATIGSNSWGNDVQGEYDTDAAQFDELVRDADPTTPGDQPYVLEFSAGNAGPDSETLDSPASGKNVIATGACENAPNTPALSFGLYGDDADTMADFSSRGPCADGRIKPDLVAPGTWIASLASSAAVDEASIAWLPIDNYYVYMGGTSMSGPHAAGAAAVFVQYYKSLHTNAIPSPALVKAALINSANELDQSNGGPGPIPNNDEGWGRITLTNIIVTNIATAPRFYQYLDQAVLLTNGQVYEQHAFVQNSDQPLKITLAYTDVPGFPGAIPALVNDLDLEVVGPDGTLYRGNQFAAGESVPNAPSADNLNNVEGVHLAQPSPGDYLVRVRARNIVDDARLETAAIDQDFALVVSGDLSRPGVGLVLMDRTNYTAPSVIDLAVLDQAKAGSNSVSVLVKSTTEPAGESVTLSAAGSYGAFTGSVATQAGAATPDGELQIHNGDAIEADYVDASGVTRITRATADLIAPSVTLISVTSDLGIITITWQTAEPANSIIRLGTNSAFNLVASDSSLVTSHLIRLTGLVAGQTYQFYVSSADDAGNVGTNNNAGSYYSFVALPTPTVLMVDDYDNAAESDVGSTVIDDGAYTNALAASGFNFAFWKVTERGSPQLADLKPFPMVIWRTTDDSVNYGYDADGFPDPSATNNTLSAHQQTIIQSYLNGGGAFFMASMGILSQLGDVPFRRDVLHVGGFKLNPDDPSPCTDCDEDFGVPAVLGAAGDPITVGMAITLDYSQYPSFSFDDGSGDVIAYGPDFSDTFTPATNATPIFFESVSGKACGMSYPQVGADSPGRVVFLSFPLDSVPVNGTAPDNEVTLLRNIISFLVPGANGIGIVHLNSRLYTIPDQVVIEIGDSDLAGTGQAQATFSTTSSSAKVTVTLNETTHPGLFRGYLSLVSSNAGPNQLVVNNGATITASYFDASRQSNVMASAGIDTVPPIISAVASTTSFGDAQVTWLTSKPADSLVQYGLSVILDRTAYGATLTTNHSVTLSGLQAERDYYYQVVSRDEADNTTTDDNQGALYKLTTRPAPRPPWFDDLETGAPGWTVVPDSGGSDVNWTLGTPNNTLETTAHSGVNAWGSNLRDQSFSIASTFLYSPVINLSGFSQATLTFWDSFDFSSGLEIGQLGISTNSSTPPASVPTLASFTDQTAGWESETFDLTPFVGQTIQIVWYYQGVSIGSTLHGWLLDDIGITGTAAGQGGNVVISANLSQASFKLSGPASLNGTCLTTTLTNAPLGDYTISFGDVAFHQTPTNQSGSLLNAGDTLNFTGNYTFVDANHNGISDAWEKFYFTSVSTNRTSLTDSDGDGMTDYEEFLAGTDPTNAASKFVFLGASTRINSEVQFQWSAIPGRSYQVLSSSDFINWTPVSDWMQATVSPMSFSVTNSAASRSYRVQVRP